MLGTRRLACRWTRKKNLLVWLGDVHVQSLFGNRLQSGATRRIANGLLQANALRCESVALALKGANVAGLPNAKNSRPS